MAGKEQSRDILNLGLIQSYGHIYYIVYFPLSTALTASHICPNNNNKESITQFKKKKLKEILAEERVHVKT